MKSATALKMEDINYYEKIESSSQKVFVSIQSNCALCCTNLELSVSSKETGTIKEEAYCPQCELRLRSREHTLQ